MSRNKFIVTALAPQLITGICLYLYFNENIIDWVRAFFLMWAALNFGGGGSGDFYTSIILLKYPRKSRVEDDVPKVGIHY